MKWFEYSIYILAIQEAAWTLEKNYGWISQELGMEFNPLQVVLEFEDENSPFWEKVFENHLVQGILHGYGGRNAYFFEQKMHLQEKNDFDLFNHPLFKSAKDRKDKNSFPLPRFRSFSRDLAHDPIFQKYKKEGKEIEKLLKGKNSTDLILHQLGYKDSSIEEHQIAFQ